VSVLQKGFSEERGEGVVSHIQKVRHLRKGKSPLRRGPFFSQKGCRRGIGLHREKKKLHSIVGKGGGNSKGRIRMTGAKSTEKEGDCNCERKMAKEGKDVCGFEREGGKKGKNSAEKRGGGGKEFHVLKRGGSQWKETESFRGSEKVALL